MLDLQNLDVVTAYRSVRRDDGEGQHVSLSDEQSVEGIAVVKGETRDRESVAELDR